MNTTNIVSEWLEAAKIDYFSAVRLSEEFYPRLTVPAAYHCQQSVEKTLKAFLVYKGIEPPHTHDLVRLCELCENECTDFADFEDDCFRLTPYAVETRYPKQMDVTVDETESAIVKSKGIYEFVFQAIPELDASLNLYAHQAKSGETNTATEPKNLDPPEESADLEMKL